MLFTVPFHLLRFFFYHRIFLFDFSVCHECLRVSEICSYLLLGLVRRFFDFEAGNRYELFCTLIGEGVRGERG